LFYTVDFECDDREPLQAELNRICDYQDDVETKVLHRDRMNLFFLLVQDLVRKGVVKQFDSALDIGCNTGVYSRMLSDFGFRHVVGVDIVPDMIARATQTFGLSTPGRSIEFHVENAEQLATDRKFDLVLCTEVIEHTNDPGAVVERIKQLVAPGGVAVVTLPNAWSFPYLVARIAYAIKRPARNLEFEDHLKYPFPRSLRLLRGGGLKLVRVDGANLLLETHLLHAWYGKPLFGAFNRLQFALGRWGPFRYFTQFFFMLFVPER
jgi:SAM-dependent methyltransferase